MSSTTSKPNNAKKENWKILRSRFFLNLTFYAGNCLLFLGFFRAKNEGEAATRTDFYYGSFVPFFVRPWIRHHLLLLVSALRISPRKMHVILFLWEEPFLLTSKSRANFAMNGKFSIHIPGCTYWEYVDHHHAITYMILIGWNKIPYPCKMQVLLYRILELVYCVWTVHVRNCGMNRPWILLEKFHLLQKATHQKSSYRASQHPSDKSEKRKKVKHSCSYRHALVLLR